MDSFDKKWKKRFDQESFDLPSDWSPPAAIMDNVEAELFPKKKRRGILFWWFGGLLSLVFVTAFSFYYFNRPAEVSSQARSISSNQLNEKAVSNKTNLIDKDISVGLESLKRNNSNSSISSSEQKTGQIRENTQPEQKKSTNTQRISSPVPPRVVKGEMKTSTSMSSNQSSVDNTMTSPKSENQLRQHVTSSDFISSASIPNSTSLSKNGTSKKTSAFLALSKLGMLRLSLFDMMHPQLNLSSPVIVRATNDNVNKWQLSLGALAGRWDLKLNKDYSDALDPADFYQQDQKSFGLWSQVDYQLSKKWYASFGITYERVEGRSGHNSAVTYQLSNESTPLHNDLAMNLGTPYGLVSSKVTFRRSSDLMTDEEVVVDVASKHTFSSLSANLMINNRLLSAGRFSLDLGVGPQWSRIFSFDNSVKFNVLNSPKVSVTDYSIVSTQEINTTIWSARASLSPSFRFNTRMSIRGQFVYVHGLGDIYAQSAFSVRPRSYSAGLSLGYQF